MQSKLVSPIGLPGKHHLIGHMYALAWYIDTSLAVIPSSILSDILYFRCNVTSVDFMPMFGPLSVIVREEVDLNGQESVD